MGSDFHDTVATRNTDANQRDIELVRRGNESTAGFARLAESGTFNEVSAVKREKEGEKEGILKRESFELRYHAMAQA